jgi:hypothetical protein
MKVERKKIVLKLKIEKLFNVSFKINFSFISVQDFPFLFWLVEVSCYATLSLEIFHDFVLLF